MAEKTPDGAEQEKVEQQPESPEKKGGTVEKEGRKVEEILKELKNTAQLYKDLYEGIDSSFNATSALLAEKVGDANLKDKKTIGAQLETMQDKENAAMKKMAELSQELSVHPDAAPVLRKYVDMSTAEIVDHLI